jgi:hypothetical protein
VAKSITIIADALELVNDAATPGNDKYYGTNGAGAKGWFAIATGGANQLSDLTDVLSADPTNRNVLVANGTQYVGRALTEADISDLQAYLIGNQTITLTGDVTGSGETSIITDIANNAVTLANIQQISTARFLGRLTSGTGNVEELSGTQATTLLDAFTSSLKGLAPASGGGTTNFLRADGGWADPLVSAQTPWTSNINAAGFYLYNIPSIRDSDENEVITFEGVINAINQIKFSNASTGNNPSISVDADDTNVGLNIILQGANSNLIILPDQIGNANLVVGSNDASYNGSLSIYGNVSTSTGASIRNFGSGNAFNSLTVDGAGDPYLLFSIGTTRRYSIGIDNSVTGDPLKITTGTSSANPSVGTELIRLTFDGNLGLNGASFGGGVGVMFVLDAVTIPNSNPTGGGIFYVEGGALKYRGSAGTITTIANA